MAAVTLENDLNRFYPRIYRIAAALSADPIIAQTVTDQVVRRSVIACDNWQDDDQAARWFMHYTVLISRQFAAKVIAENDPLAIVGPAWIEFIRAVRGLPSQQREAFLLHHGEMLELRQMATAMDCSSSAAANHLVAAAKALREISHDDLGGFTNALPGLMEKLSPPPQRFELKIKRIVRKMDRHRFLGRWIARLVEGILFAALAYVGWWLWNRIVI